MWNDQSAVGGFLNSGTQFGNTTTPGQQQKTGRRASRTAPIVIRQALHCGDEGITIWGTNVQIVSVVARVRNIRMQSTKITYTIQDITGRMRAVLWLDQDAAEDDSSVVKVEINEYIQIYGNIKTNKGKKVLMAFKIMPITDVNAMTFHYLQCINNKVKMEAESKKEKVDTKPGFTTNAMPSNSMVGMNDGGSVNGLNPQQMMVYNLIRASMLEQGISKQDMYAQLSKSKMSQVEFEKHLEWMCGEGHIYTTIDEEHFRATDAV